MRIVNIKEDKVVKQEQIDDFNKFSLADQKAILEDRLEFFRYVSARGIVEYTFEIDKVVYASSFPNGIVNFMVKRSTSRGLSGNFVRINFRDISEIRRQTDEDGFYSVYFKSNPTVTVDLFW